MKDLIKRLESIGLSEKQASVYLALVSLGDATAYAIAKKSGQKRSTVYVILDELFTSGLVLKVPHRKKQIYIAKSLDEYLQDQERYIKEVKQVMPRIRSLQKESKTQVLVFEGFEGIKESMYHTMNRSDHMEMNSFYSSLGSSAEKYLPMFDQWNEDSLRSGTKFKIIVAKEDAEKYFHLLTPRIEKGRFEMKFIDYPYPDNSSFEIGNDFVRITSVEEERTTIIESKSVADAFREIFKIVWERD